MNHIYRTVWHELSRTFVAVAETVRSKGRTGSVSTTAQGETSLAGNEDKENCGVKLLFRRRQPLVHRGIRLLALEQRFMFDGAAVADAAHTLPDATARALIPDVPAPVEVRAADLSQNNGKKEVAFVDTSVANYKTLEAGIRAGVEVVEIDGSQNGLAQIAKWAESHTGYDAIHILSHGSNGTLLLGSTTINNASLANASVQAELAQLSQALTRDGDLLLYGCNVAADAKGHSFVANLAAATGADVAASVDATGGMAQGGNWNLESKTGTIEASGLEFVDYNNLLVGATFDFESSPGGSGSKTITQTNSGETIQLTSSSTNMIIDTESNYAGGDLALLTGNVAWNDYQTNVETQTVISLQSGKLFDLSSMTIAEWVGNGDQAVLTTSKGSVTLSSLNATSTSFVVSSLSASDQAKFQGITSITVTSMDGSYDFAYDNIVLTNIHAAGPTVTDAKISITSTGSGTGGAYKIGDTVTASWDNTASGDNNSNITGVTMDFSAFGGGSAVTATNSSGVWTASYVITSGSIDGASKNVSVTATDSNSGTTTTSDTTNLTVDNQAPTVTDAKISISGASGTGGAYKIGDTVTATWNNTAGGDNNSDTISGVTVDFSQFGGGSTVAATNSGGTWTATYTMTAGSIDGSSRNISITATDNAGNTTTTADTTNATVDNIAPTLTDAKISISGASGAGGVYKIGDTVTATWNNTAGGDNNSDTISGVTVDFSQFGGGSAVAAANSGGTWTATYTIVAGALNNSTNRNVSATATDNAGNATTTADSTNATVDNVAPTITFSNLAFSSDTGASSTDFLTQTASQTITATLSGAPAGTDIVYGSLDNGATWTDITSKVSGATLTWDNVTLSSSSTLKLKVADAAGNDGTVKSQAYTLDSSAPGAPSAPAFPAIPAHRAATASPATRR